MTEGKVLHHPLVGHRITILQPTVATGGELLQVEYAVERPETGPASIVPPHIHLQTEERFAVIAGQLGVILNGEQRVLRAGEELSIPPRTPHTFWNAGSGELRFITDIRPAGRLQEYWEALFGLAAAGKVGKNGLPHLLQFAVIAPLADAYAAGVPLPLTKGAIALLGGIGRLLGYRIPA